MILLFPFWAFSSFFEPQSPGKTSGGCWTPWKWGQKNSSPFSSLLPDFPLDVKANTPRRDERNVLNHHLPRLRWQKSLQRKKIWTKWWSDHSEYSDSWPPVFIIPGSLSLSIPPSHSSCSCYFPHHRYHEHVWSHGIIEVRKDHQVQALTHSFRAEG